MDKIDFDFFCQLLKENLCYAEISEILKKYCPKVKGFLVTSIKNFCKKKGLSSRISQDDVNEMVRVAVEEVKVFITIIIIVIIIVIIIILFHHYWALIFSNIRAKLKIKNMYGGSHPFLVIATALFSNAVFFREHSGGTLQTHGCLDFRKFLIYFRKPTTFKIFARNGMLLSYIIIFLLQL